MAFPDNLIKAWEAEDCINFAIALSRITGWLLHVDWWVNSRVEAINLPTDSVPLRVYVQNDLNDIYDVRGFMNVFDFALKITKPAVMKRGLASKGGGVLTRFYSESELSKLTLKFASNEADIDKAIAAIKNNPEYLAKIPTRNHPSLPAHEAGKFAFGRCSPYAQALSDLTGLPAAALLAVSFPRGIHPSQLSEDCYIHTVVLHKNGEAEDSWGRNTIDHIAARFGVTEARLDMEKHKEIITKIKNNSPEQYQEAYKQAVELIKKYRK